MEQPPPPGPPEGPPEGPAQNPWQPPPGPYGPGTPAPTGPWQPYGVPADPWAQQYALGFVPGPYAMGYPVQKTNAKAVASLVLGCSALLCGLTAVVGLVLGYVARKEIDESGGMQTGRGMAVAGIVIGWVISGLIAAYLVFLIVIALTTQGDV